MAAKPRLRVGLLGAGVMGSCLAMNLARLGADVTLIDRNPQPMQEASRYNEGKIHLGYLYGADTTLSTARHVLPGGLAFARLISPLIGSDIRAHATTSDDIYLVDQDSLIDAEALGAQFDAVSDLVRHHPEAAGYLTDVSNAAVSRLSRVELENIASDRITAGYRVPERSVDTGWVADALAEAVMATPQVTFLPGITVTGVAPGVDEDTIAVYGTPGFEDRFDVVVNALWGGRVEIDLTAGLRPARGWTHRVRWCLFVRTTARVDVPSAIVALGPFGDIKNYNGHDFYLSWYPSGLVAHGTDVVLEAPALPTGPARVQFIEDVRAGLCGAIPRVGDVLDAAESITVAGGHVFAEGLGSIGERSSDLHRRDRFGVTRLGNYVSVDTGKFSTAPWLADRLARQLMGVT
ncbi:FAD-dependent oxidoreductase [Tessaracoccus sp. Z1128]